MSVLELARRERAEQLSLSAMLVQELVELWWAIFGRRPPGPSNAPAVAEILTALVQEYGAASATLAADAYEAQRREAGVTGRFEVPVADVAGEEQVTAATGWVLRDPPASTRTGDVEQTGRGRGDARAALDLRDRPIDLDRLAERRLADATGAAQRLAAQPGRRTLENAIIQDPAAVAWARITDADPCAFCYMLASRGFVYLEESTALHAQATGEPYHDHDQCTVAPRFRTDRSPLPTANQAAQDLWYRTGAYFTGSEALNAFERALRAQRTGRDVAAAVFDGPASDPERYRRAVTHDRATVEQFRRAAQRGGTNGRPPVGPDGASDPRYRS